MKRILRRITIVLSRVSKTLFSPPLDRRQTDVYLYNFAFRIGVLGQSSVVDLVAKSRFCAILHASRQIHARR